MKVIVDIFDLCFRKKRFAYFKIKSKYKFHNNKAEPRKKQTIKLSYYILRTLKGLDPNVKCLLPNVIELISTFLSGEIRRIKVN